MTTDEKVVRNDARIGAVEEWCKRQNGSIQRIEDRIDELFHWFLFGFGGLILATIADMVLGRI